MTLELSFASGESSLSVRRIVVSEGISTLFDVGVIARSEEASLNLESMIGTTASLHASTAYAFAGAARQWSGLCCYAEQVQGHGSEAAERNLST
jgi:type VI secretion system secreted protein VgrG